MKRFIFFSLLRKLFVSWFTILMFLYIHKKSYQVQWCCICIQKKVCVNEAEHDFFSLLRKEKEERLLTYNFLWFCLVLFKKWAKNCVVVCFAFLQRQYLKLFYARWKGLTCVLIEQRFLYSWVLYSVLLISSNSFFNGSAFFASRCHLWKRIFLYNTCRFSTLCRNLFLP